MSIYKRRSGRYAVLIDLDPTSLGGRRRRSLGTYATRKEAERAEREALSARDRGIDLAPRTVTIAGLLARFLQERRERWAPKTYERCEEIIEHYITPHLGTRTIAKLRPAHVAEWCATLRERGGRLITAEDGKTHNRPLSSKTVHHAYVLLKGAFAWAVRMQLAAVNPLAAVEPPKVIRHEAQAFGAEDIHKLLLAADGTRWQNLIAFALATGARRGEIAALRWNAIDLDARTATIRASLSDTKSGTIEKSTKSERPRVVPLSAMATDALKRESLTHEQAKRWSRRPYSDSTHVFQGPLGGHVRPYEITDGFRKVARRAGVPLTSFHALRHTAATWMLIGGVDARTTAGVLGHSTPSTTLGIYAHVIASAQAAAVTTIEDRLRKVGGSRDRLRPN